MGKLAAVAVVVAGVLGGAGPRPVEAEDIKLPPGLDLYHTAVFIGHLLNSERSEEDRLLAQRLTFMESSVARRRLLPEEAFIGLVDTVEVAHRAAVNRTLAEMRLYYAALDEAETSDPDEARRQLGPGLRTGADVLNAFQGRADASLQRTIEKGVGSVAKACAKAGLAINHVLRAPRTPHPAYGFFGIVPVSPPLIAALGSSDGRLSVITNDVGAPRGAEAWRLEIRDDPASGPVAVRPITSSLDFSTGGPTVFRFTGLPPATYFVSAVIPFDGSDVTLDTMPITVPPAGPARAPDALDRELARKAREWALELITATRASGRSDRKEAKQTSAAVRDGDLTPELARDRVAEAARRMHCPNDLKEIGLALHDAFGQVAGSSPAAVDRQSGAGNRSAADAFETSQHLALGMASGEFAKYFERVDAACEAGGLDLSYVASGPDCAEHPAFSLRGFAPHAPPLVCVVAASDGKLSVVMRDPAFGQPFDRSIVRIVDPETSAVLDERALTSSADFGGNGLAARTFDFFGVPPGVRVVRTYVASNGEVLLVDDEIVAVPVSGTAPPLPCTGTTAEFIVAGQPVAIPPLDRFRMFTSGNTLTELYLCFRNPLSSSVPTVNFDMSSSIDLDGPQGVSMTVTLPQDPVFIARPYLYNPATRETTQMASGTITIEGLRNLRQAGGCASATFSGMTASSQPVSGRFTMGTDQLQP